MADWAVDGRSNHVFLVWEGRYNNTFIAPQKSTIRPSSKVCGEHRKLTWFYNTQKLKLLLYQTQTHTLGRLNSLMQGSSKHQAMGIFFFTWLIAWASCCVPLVSYQHPSTSWKCSNKIHTWHTAATFLDHLHMHQTCLNREKSSEFALHDSLCISVFFQTQYLTTYCWY